MTQHGDATHLRPCRPSDDAFLHDVFATTWEDAVAALPNPALAQHVVRIQHIAQERRFAKAHPGHLRFVVVHEGVQAGRLYLHRHGRSLRIVDITLLSRYRGRGIGTALVREICAQAALEDRTVSMRVPRADDEVIGLWRARGFRVVAADDVTQDLQWSHHQALEPALAAPGASRS